MDINNALVSFGPEWVRVGFQAFKKDAGELSRTLWGRVFLFTSTWHLATIVWDRIAYPDQAPLALLAPPVLGYSFLVGYAGWHSGKWVFRRLRPTRR